MNKRIIMIVAGLVVLLAGGWYFASPMMALKNMQTAVEARDADALSAQIDFPALREDLKAEMSAAMMAEAQKNGSEGAAAAMLGAAFADKMIDGMVSPAGVKMLMANADKGAAVGAGAGQAGLAGAPDLNKLNSDNFTVERSGFSEFKLRNKKDPKSGAMVFRRDGLGWKLAGIDIPAETAGK